MAEPLFWDDVEPSFPHHGNLFSTFLHCRTLNWPFLCLTASMKQFHPKRSGCWCVSWWFIDSIVCIVSLGDGMIIFWHVCFPTMFLLSFAGVYLHPFLWCLQECALSRSCGMFGLLLSLFLCLVPHYSHYHWCFKSWCFKWKKKKTHIYEVK